MVCSWISFFTSSQKFILPYLSHLYRKEFWVMRVIRIYAMAWQWCVIKSWKKAYPQLRLHLFIHALTYWVKSWAVAWHSSVLIDQHQEMANLPCLMIPDGNPSLRSGQPFRGGQNKKVLSLRKVVICDVQLPYYHFWKRSTEQFFYRPSPRT